MNETATDIYRPPSSKLLSELQAEPQLRVGLQGPPGCGKTWCSLTFPNPIVLNFDRGLGAHVGRPDVQEIPFYDPKFVDSVKARTGLSSPPNRRDALLIWLSQHGTKLSCNQTLVIDSLTQLQNAFHSEYDINPTIARSGKIDEFAVWNQKVRYFGDLCDMLKALPCHVVLTSHETADRDKDGNYNGGVRPLLTGQFADQLASHFTDFFRCHAFAKPSGDRMAKFKEVMLVDDVGSRELIASTSPSCQSIYMLQTQADEICKCKTSTLVGAPKFVLANYSTFSKYKRK